MRCLLVICIKCFIYIVYMPTMYVMYVRLYSMCFCHRRCCRYIVATTAFIEVVCTSFLILSMSLMFSSMSFVFLRWIESKFTDSIRHTTMNRDYLSVYWCTPSIHPMYLCRIIKLRTKAKCLWKLANAILQKKTWRSEMIGPKPPFEWVLLLCRWDVCQRQKLCNFHSIWQFKLANWERDKFEKRLRRGG